MTRCVDEFERPPTLEIRIQVPVSRKPDPPIVEGIEKKSYGSRREKEFVFDCGADVSLLRQDLIEELGLEPLGEKVLLESATRGYVSADLYYAFVAIGGRHVRIRCAPFPAGSPIKHENLLSACELLQEFDILLSHDKLRFYRKGELAALDTDQ